MLEKIFEEVETELPRKGKAMISDFYKERVKDYILTSILPMDGIHGNVDSNFLIFTKSRLISAYGHYNKLKHRHRDLSDIKVLDCLDFKTIDIGGPREAICITGRQSDGEYFEIRSKSEHIRVDFTSNLWTYPRLKNEILARLSKMLKFSLNNSQLKSEELKYLQGRMQSFAGSQPAFNASQQSAPIVISQQPNPAIDHELLQKRIVYSVAPTGSVTIYNIKNMYNNNAKTMNLQDSVAVMR